MNPSFLPFFLLQPFSGTLVSGTAPPRPAMEPALIRVPSEIWRLICRPLSVGDLSALYLALSSTQHVRVRQALSVSAAVLAHALVPPDGYSESCWRARGTKLYHTVKPSSRKRKTSDPPLAARLPPLHPVERIWLATSQDNLRSC